MDKYINRENFLLNKKHHPKGGVFPGGVGGIRTLEPVKATRFPIVLVMTTSILLRVSHSAKSV